MKYIIINMTTLKLPNNCKLYVLKYDYKNDDLQEIINTIQSLN